VDSGFLGSWAKLFGIAWGYGARLMATLVELPVKGLLALDQAAELFQVYFAFVV
jgi:hypothetical protein